jgi:hypothetical protein
VNDDPGPLYQLCVDPECPYDFAYRFDATSTVHYHYVGPPREFDEEGSGE